MSRTVVVQAQDHTSTRDVPTVESWNAIAKDVAQQLKPGTILALSGPLGAGKTTFVQVLAQELGITRLPPSPTFALMRSYAIPGAASLRRLIHVDAYRIEKPSDLLALDLDEELADGESALVMEWPEHVESWIARHLSVIRIRIELPQKESGAA